ncbi:MAG: polynucleotide kinase-phosphatase [Armatimonadota bacterium]|nr:polynucleotide kinase-phosphatase [Armatimonadota bacterium]
MEIKIPDFATVLLIGASGSGKSTFAKKHFLPTEILSSDECRGWVCDDESSLEATTDAFDVLNYVLGKRLARRRLTVVDATNVQDTARRGHLVRAKQYHSVAVAIVMDVPESVCLQRNEPRPDRNFGPHVVRRQSRDLKRSLRNLKREGFRYIHVLSPDTIEDVQIVREPLWTDRRFEHGPFDIIGDVHGCRQELEDLLAKLGYGEAHTPPAGRKAVFLGDLVDRGPDTPGVLKIVMAMVARGDALCVPGNHDIKLLRKLRGANVQLTHGLDKSLEQLASESEELSIKVAEFIDSLISHYVLDDGKLIVAHAGMREDMQGRASGAVRQFALFGETTGETDELGLPVRFDWAREYKGEASVIFGHTPIEVPEWFNRTLNIDTGCVFGGKLTALRYPEMELVQVPAKAEYAEGKRTAPMSNEETTSDNLQISDVLGRMNIHARLRGNITIHEDNSAAALEIMSRFATDPKGLIYLPPTMSPTESSTRSDYLEYPDQAFEHYHSRGISRTVCQRKHMGSRAVIIVCRSKEVAMSRFGVANESGVIYTRTGRRFFDDLAIEDALIDRVRKAADATGFWDAHNTSWVALDCELMPWSAKAKELLVRQYAPVGASGIATLELESQLLEQAASRLESEELTSAASHTKNRLQMLMKYRDAYRHYCWEVEKTEDFRIAPFHVLATEGAVHFDKDHLWHMSEIAKLCEAEGEILMKTDAMVVDLADDESRQSATEWWVNMTSEGGEGMVVKPIDFIAKGAKGLVQPAVKCRGREYLRIIYGPEYTSDENLPRLRARRLARKRDLAMREFALGHEGLARFVARDGISRVHECAFAVLALESEPVDPRL